MNGSDQSLHKRDTEILILELLILIIALAGLAGNMVVLWLLGFHMQMKAFSIHILKPAGADFLLLGCEIMHSLCTLLHFYSNTINICNIVFTVSVFAYISGLSLLSAISTERCLSVLRPIWYRCRRPRHTLAIMCAQL
uniref:G-protein coupled receptors family 1 profile domain-containing protein n=2 Tax=Molossus molossus TaxID=27622 RepID=A0A7J8ER85_MOLMO|nr:hypothetical protein HJG59_008720 [Molossus molossus]